MEILKAILIALIATLAPIHGLIMIVGFLIFADLITGMIAAYNRGEKMKSSAMRRTLVKMAAYQFAVISGFVLELLVPGSLPIAKMVAGAIGIVELKSILENVESVAGEPIFKKIFKAFGSDNDKP